MHGNEREETIMRNSTQCAVDYTAPTLVLIGLFAFVVTQTLNGAAVAQEHLVASSPDEIQARGLTCVFENARLRP